MGTLKKAICALSEFDKPIPLVDLVDILSKGKSERQRMNIHISLSVLSRRHPDSFRREEYRDERGRKRVRIGLSSNGRHYYNWLKDHYDPVTDIDFNKLKRNVLNRKISENEEGK